MALPRIGSPTGSPSPILQPHSPNNGNGIGQVADADAKQSSDNANVGNSPPQASSTPPLPPAVPPAIDEKLADPDEKGPPPAPVNADANVEFNQQPSPEPLITTGLFPENHQEVISFRQMLALGVIDNRYAFLARLAPHLDAARFEQLQNNANTVYADLSAQALAINLEDASNILSSAEEGCEFALDGAEEDEKPYLQQRWDDLYYLRTTLQTLEDNIGNGDASDELITHAASRIITIIRTATEV
jgi:hypothetical protein